MESNGPPSVIIDGEIVINGTRPNGEGLPADAVPEGSITDYAAWMAAYQKAQARRRAEINKWGQDRGVAFSKQAILDYVMRGVMPNSSPDEPASPVLTTRRPSTKFANNSKTKAKRHIQIPIEVLDSDAGKQLESEDIHILTRLLKRNFGENNGRLGASNRDLMEETNHGAKTIVDSIRRLRRLGLIALVKEYPKTLLLANEYRITWLPSYQVIDAGGESESVVEVAATNEWRLVPPGPRKQRRGRKKGVV